MDEKKIVNTYHKTCFLYLLKVGTAENGSQIADHFKDYENRGKYNAALKDLENNGDVEEVNGKWILTEKYSLFKTQDWRNFFNNNATKEKKKETLVYKILSPEKKTFLEFFNDFMDIVNDIRPVVKNEYEKDKVGYRRKLITVAKPIYKQ